MACDVAPRVCQSFGVQNPIARRGTGQEIGDEKRERLDTAGRRNAPSRLSDSANSG